MSEPRFSLQQLREYLADKQRLQEDVAIVDTDELRALVDAVEAAHAVTDHYYSEGGEFTNEGYKLIDALDHRLARFAFEETA